MLPRVFALGAALGTAGLLVAQAISIHGPVANIEAEASARALFSLPARASLELSPLLASNRAISVTLLVGDLVVGQPWTAIETENQALTVLRLTGAEAGTMLLVSTDDAEQVFFCDDELLEIHLLKEKASDVLAISINGESAGTISDTGALTLNGLASGILVITKLPSTLPALPAPLLPVNPRPSTSEQERVIGEFDRIKTTKQGMWVFTNDGYVPIEAVVDAKRGTLAALMASRNHCVFLDWEQGDDTNDGLKSHSAGGSGCGPKKTWQAAMNASQPGGVIVVTGGVYSYDETRLSQPKDLTLVPLGSIILSPLSKQNDMLADGFLVRTEAGLQPTAKYLDIIKN